jgi:hypothetical protein
MQTIGSYEYPNYASFTDALMIADEALNNYGGVIPNIEVTKKLGYKFNDPAHIAGTVYRRFDDMCMFGLFTRTKGGLKTTELAKEALDPYNEHKAAAGKARAIRNVSLIAKAFDAWQGIIPESNAFPAKLAEITETDWTICRNHVPNLQKLFAEAFPILKSTSVLKELPSENLRRRETGITKEINLQSAGLASSNGSKPELYGEVKTTVGTVIIKDKMTLEVARKLLDIVEDQLQPQKMEKKKTKAAKAGGGKEEVIDDAK